MNYLLNVDNIILHFCSVVIKNNFFDTVMPIASNINNNGEVWILIAIVLLLNKNIEVKEIGAAMLIALLLGLVLGEGVLKNLIGRARPTSPAYNYTFLISPPKSFSFPSGHTTSSFAAFGVCFFKKARYRYFALALAITIAFSRIYLHVHYPSDILGGIILGLISAKLAVNISKKFFRKKVLKGEG
ncbi:phosphatase PAP2 family protein [Candidatus Clostridium stratigraminis]|uniref:Phosphatase PAP2 family protein n=1 Tax=Candidatus Clostridium stratigraminis TaxID=3381661 RepID=A0ABW8T887_9CLOT